MDGIGGRCRISVLALLVCAMLFSTTMARGIRTGVTDGTLAPDRAIAVAQATTDVTPPPVAAAATAPPSEPAALGDTYKDSKRKVPNGPDPIHNRYCFLTSGGILPLPSCSIRLLCACVLVLSYKTCNQRSVQKWTHRMEQLELCSILQSTNNFFFCKNQNQELI
jgi:hypothetical protein